MTAAKPEYPLTLIVVKGGELAWLGHLDVARALERALRRADLPVRFTEGFHKRIKMRLPEPLPLGVGSDGERYVLQLDAPVDPAVALAPLAGALPRGLEVVAVLPGSHPEKKDVPLLLEFEAESASELAEAFAALAQPLPVLGGEWRLVEPVSELPDGGRALVRLEAPPGARVSVGRFLEALRSARAGGLALRRVWRRVAWQVTDGSLPSPTPFLPAAPASDGGDGSGMDRSATRPPSVEPS